MPNHVSHDLIVTGNPSVLKEFIEFAREGDALLSANKFIPYPEEYLLLDKKAEEEHKNGNLSFKDGFNSGGYQWCIAFWGTKWGIYETELVNEKLTGKIGRLKYKFNSAWSPVTRIIFAMSQRFPSLKFDLKYYESGMGFKGNYIISNCDVITDLQSDYRGSRGG